MNVHISTKGINKRKILGTAIKSHENRIDLREYGTYSAPDPLFTQTPRKISTLPTSR